MLNVMSVTFKEKEAYAKAHYDHALQLCFARAKGDERKALGHVLYHARYKLDDVFQCVIDLPTAHERRINPDARTRYTFVAPPTVMNYPDVIDLIAAHEIRHALFGAEDKIFEKPNVHSRKNALLNLAEELPKIRRHIRQATYKVRHRDDDGVVKALLKGAAYWALHAIGTIVSPVVAAASHFSRIEEKACDTYGFKQFPDTDLDAFRKMLYLERPGVVDDLDRTVARNAKLGDFSLWLGDIFTSASHPHPERRFRHLQSLQQKTAAKPAAAPVAVT